jgi:hypothetical protein
VLPFDHSAVQRSIAAQRPLVLDESSRAGRVLLDLASRVHGGKLVLPPEPDAPPRRGLRGLAERVSGGLHWPALIGAGRISTPVEGPDAHLG